jgi:small GTP-binding protein
MTEDVLKLVILGEGRVGKTSILSKYFNNKFNDNEQKTINPAFYEKTVKYKGKTVQLKFWDTAGQEQFNAISTMYYQNSVGALLVYDVTIFETFKKVENWVRTLQEAVGKDITFVIAGNKVDLKDKNKSQEHTLEIDSYCAKEHCKHFYTSAKTGYNLEEVFECLINSVLSKVKPEEGGGSKRRGKRIEISDQQEKKKEKGGCC